MTSLSWLRTLEVADIAAITDLLAAAERADGNGGVSEDVRLTLRSGPVGGGVEHLVARAGPAVVGYAALGGTAGERQAELVVHPDHRRAGVGTALVRALLEATSATDRTARPAPVSLNVWAHGDTPAATALAARNGFDRERVLLQLRRPLTPVRSGDPDDLPRPIVPADVTIRAFEVGVDEQAWLAVNAEAFADHPEQGRWTLDDLRAREREPWFDPAGFFLAERAGALLGFHWTKVHPRDPVPDRSDAPDRSSRPPGPIGEVYVVGVASAAVGAGLGAALTIVGLRHLRDSGLAAVMLYVDEDNTRAVRLYTRLGFRRHAADVSYRHVVRG
ncbi:mycothiol synthase [Parafrankia discariae]|uniref:mycothiol synthase n=1 Tax=Parafrankia discariae TaxID=365528 RepID=UPI000378F964|nr:mycothiol synthase [Parafrankia discariae]